VLYTIFRLLHYLAILVLASALIIDNIAISPTISDEDASNFVKVDNVFRISAVLVAVFGLILWLWVGKPREFYRMNLFFQIKLGLFVLAAVLSIYPTFFFFKVRRDAAGETAVPASVRLLMRLKLLLLVIIPTLAYLMARGIDLII
jgi:putative membrane protein|tara:strand:- start:28 stop:465 length:438 start_codon:yes stop_codon:yes gene_type:complete